MEGPHVPLKPRKSISFPILTSSSAPSAPMPPPRSGRKGFLRSFASLLDLRPFKHVGVASAPSPQPPAGAPPPLPPKEHPPKHRLRTMLSTPMLNKFRSPKPAPTHHIDPSPPIRTKMSLDLDRRMAWKVLRDVPMIETVQETEEEDEELPDFEDMIRGDATIKVCLTPEELDGVPVAAC
ncbi:uncharacterized protein SPPG_05271 [Spizellomyces punctatus DAOM BR117]|uniref:Uncharacterized protein n=1 Tax=Spizellomyces punctatus (strain DAOM BR117) TaxID=645134 RepID=A0A0L0HG57_SPIPD|nr:uncharacterized protein SPPG_05271 [Spizellomyces punctatus DAOM BR117]KNC99899.1 hypothetical protein SPPG_05271 [Spizellomyces punctatus DAOM BR117]|eukprot:XP_016607939.1 hypothetical protein SPPG_05271 [Spizellomyces punctatus DAOM BR117]